MPSEARIGGPVQVEAWDTEARLAHLRLRRQRQARRKRRQRLAVAAIAALAVVALVVSLVYAGSERRIADGVSIAGLDVGGLSSRAAVALLEQREDALAATPLPLQVGGRTYEVRPGALGVKIDWRGAVEAAHESTGGFRPFRGFHRLATRALGTDVEATARANPAALRLLLVRLGRGDVPRREATIKLVGLRPVVVEARAGLGVDAKAAEAAILGAFASLDRTPVTLERTVDEPRVTAEMLAGAAARVRTALSRPVLLDLAGGHFTVSRRQLARVLELPAGGEKTLRVAGPGATAYFKALQTEVNRSPKDAAFVPVPGGRVLIKPAEVGRALDVPHTADALLAAALRPVRRHARIVVATTSPDRTTEKAKAMGITGLVSSYTTIYGGDANRVHNVQLVSNLIDDTLIAPGQTFSFNGTTGERNAAKGFLAAPVIINGELQTGLGGGVCQVSTTVFNAAYGGGLKITERTNHALYISHYPQGRDATVNYPDTDLKFVNDTDKWLLLRTFVGSSSLTVNLYGMPQDRRVETEVSPLETIGKPPTTWRKDRTVPKGQRVVASEGSPPRTTSVHRLVYAPNGDLLYDNTWWSSYRGEKRIILVGTKPKPKPQPEKKAGAPAKGAPAEPATTTTTAGGA